MLRRLDMRIWCRRLSVMLAAAVLPAGLIGCQDYDEGTTRTRTTRTQETPSERTSTTTTTERRVEDYDR